MEGVQEKVPDTLPVPSADEKVAPVGRLEAVTVMVLTGSESVALTVNVSGEPRFTVWGPGTLIAGGGLTMTNIVTE